MFNTSVFLTVLTIHNCTHFHSDHLWGLCAQLKQKATNQNYIVKGSVHNCVLNFDASPGTNQQ